MGAKSVNSAIESSLLELGSIVRLRKGQLVTQQFAKATSFYVLKTGVVSFSLVIDDAVGAIAVGQLNTPDTPVGWSGFSSPGRYAATVSVESHSATFYTWPLETLQEYFQSHPDTGTRFLQMICANARNLIKMSIDLLGTHGPAIEKDLSIDHVDFQIADASPDEDLIQFLRKSSFFEIFDEAPLAFLSQSIENRVYQTNDLIYGQGHAPDGIYILARGKVRFSHYNENMQNASFRQVSNAGYIVGWSGAVNLPNLINAHAARETLLYFISNKDLERILRLHPEFAYAFYLRLLWLVGYQLQAIRVRIIAAKFNHEVIAIGNLIDQNSTKLDLSSSLHKVPHLLDNKLTVNDALQTLEAIKSNGTTLEKNIALTALEILDEIKREHKFYSGLVSVYKHVIKSPETVPAEAIRRKNAEDYQNIFNEQHFKISGLENLPEKTGNIFIYNHLRNHSHNTLPNQFQITLDSHFISAMILMKRYGDPGLRIVRIGQGVEYAHQEYYQRLGHIDVFTEDAQNKTKKDRKRVRQMFYHEAGKYVQSGGNLIISPEGNSYGTEESPGPFKPGAFQLATSIKKEPLIVPIALANFDRRIRNNCFSCVILPPFKASDYIRDPSDKEEMKKFLHEYQHTYRTYVEKAIAQSKEYMWTSN